MNFIKLSDKGKLRYCYQELKKEKNLDNCLSIRVTIKEIENRIKNRVGEDLV